MLVEAELVDARVQRRAQRAGAADQQVRLRQAPGEDRHRGQQRVEAHARFEIAHGEQERPVEREAELDTDVAPVPGRPEAREVGAPGDLHESLGRNAIELPQQGGREVAQDVDARRAPQARALDRPQGQRAGQAGGAAEVMRGHPPPRAVLERRRRVERVERGQAPAARGGQDAVGGERLVQMQDVGLLEERRRRLPRLLHRVAQEAEQRAPAGGELDDVDPAAPHAAGGRLGGGAAQDAQRVAARGQPGARRRPPGPAPTRRRRSGSSREAPASTAIEVLAQPQLGHHQRP